jgi:hypothetical protein
MLETRHGGGVQLEALLANENLFHPGAKNFVVGPATKTFENKGHLSGIADAAPWVSWTWAYN